MYDQREVQIEAQRMSDDKAQYQLEGIGWVDADHLSPIRIR